MTLESQGTCLPVVSRQESILLSLAISDYIYHDCASLLINLTVALLLRMLQYYLIVRPPLYISNLIMASGWEKKRGTDLLPAFHSNGHAGSINSDRFCPLQGSSFGTASVKPCKCPDYWNQKERAFPSFNGKDRSLFPAYCDHLANQYRKQLGHGTNLNPSIAHSTGCISQTDISAAG